MLVYAAGKSTLAVPLREEHFALLPPTGSIIMKAAVNTKAFVPALRTLSPPIGALKSRPARRKGDINRVLPIEEVLEARSY